MSRIKSFSFFDEGFWAAGKSAISNLASSIFGNSTTANVKGGYGTANVPSCLNYDFSLGPLVSNGATSSVSSSGFCFDTSNRFAYMIDNGSQSILALRRNLISGSLSSIGSIGGFATLRRLAMDPLGRWICVVDGGGNKIYLSSISRIDGSLSALSNIAVGTAPRPIAVHPDGIFVYVGNQTTGTISVIKVSSDGITLSIVSTATLANCYGIAMDPFGRFLFATNNTGNTVTPFSINQTTGALTIGTAIATGSGASESTVDPSGFYLYVGNMTAGTVSQYSINQSSGALTSLGPDVTSVTAAQYISNDIYGRCIYVGGTGSVAVMAISSTGTISLVQTLTSPAGTGSFASSYVPDLTGKFLYSSSPSSTSYFSKIGQVLSVSPQIPITIGANSAVSLSPMLSTTFRGQIAISDGAGNRGTLTLPIGSTTTKKDTGDTAIVAGTPAGSSNTFGIDYSSGWRANNGGTGGITFYWSIVATWIA